MKEHGQGFDVFRLAIFAVVLIAIIFLISAFFVPEKKSALQELNKSLDDAQFSAGKAITNMVFFEKNFSVSAKNVFDRPIRSVSFACNSPQCAQKTLLVDARQFVATEELSIQYTARCEFEKGLYNCRLYFGTKPAQLKISGIPAKEAYDLQKEKVSLEFLVENTGELTAADVLVEARIFRKEGQGSEQTQNLYSEPLKKEMQSLAPLQRESINFTLPISDSGSYLVQISARAIDAGFEEKPIEFFAKGNIVSPSCTAREKLETFFNETENKCITRYSCSGCESAFECRVVWEERQPQTVFESSTQETALEISEPAGDSCQ